MTDSAAVVIRRFSPLLFATFYSIAVVFCVPILRYSGRSHKNFPTPSKILPEELQNIHNPDRIVKKEGYYAPGIYS